MVKKKSKKRVLSNNKKLLIICFVSFLVITCLYTTWFFIDKANNVIKTGSTVKLSNNSLWYVIAIDDDTITLLSKKAVDINEDGLIDEEDQIPYSEVANKIDSLEYNDASSVGLITYGQYLKVRDTMKFGIEWSKPNFLASTEIGFYWIDASEESNLGYAVNMIGSFAIDNCDALAEVSLCESQKLKAYLRPSITLDRTKDMLQELRKVN